MSRMTDQIGRVLSGRYRLIAPIGTGASAQVYLADDVRLRRRVAVKLLHAALADDEAFLRRFRAEAQAAAALNHPHALAVFDWGEEDDGTPYLVTEYLAGGSLRAMLDRGARLSQSQALLVGLEAARALDVAHRRGFVHRDIKPANLLFGDDGRLRIADFGLARAIAEAAWTEPQGAVLGTARYASPEQVKGDRVDGRADVYALCLVLVEAVTGQVPFAADTTIATLMARVDRDVPVPDALGPLRGVLEHAGRHDPADRPDAGGLATALMAAAEELNRPAPLPLAGAMAPGSSEHRPDEPDRTVHVPVADPASPDEVEADGPALVAPAPAITSGAESGEVPPWEGAPPADDTWDDYTEEGSAAADDGRRRRWPLVVAMVVLAAILGGAATWGLMILQTPSHEVPLLVGQQEGAARRMVDEFGWRIEVNPVRVDGTEPGEITETEPPAFEQLEEGETLVLWVSQGNTLVDVPQDLAGMGLEDAVAIIEFSGFVPVTNETFHEEVPGGHVVSVDGDLPAQLPRGEEIPLTVSRGPEPRVVPDGLAGRSPDEARVALEDLQLGASVTEEFSDDVEAGVVIGVRPGPGTEVPRDETIEIVVSRGPDMVTVPDVAGMSLEEAVAAIEAAGTEAGEVFGPANGRPFDTDPGADESVRRGSTVDIYLRRG